MLDKSMLQDDYTTPDSFIIDDDAKADWAIRKIREEREEYERLADLGQQQKAEIDLRLEEAQKRCENRTAGLLVMLERYFDSVPHKTTKTQEKYQLLSGSLVRKRGTVKCNYDETALVNYLKVNYPDFVAVKEKPAWAGFKKLLDIDPDTGVVTIAETGEIVDVIEAGRAEDTFDIKF